MKRNHDLNGEYWNNRYLNSDIGWDLGNISPPLKSYVDRLSNKDLKILIPGAGNAYEAEYLFNLGFRNVFIIDISEAATLSFKKRVPEFPDENIICDDFFSFNGSFDIVLEQTFFCALGLELREQYVRKVCDLLNHGGKLIGLMFGVSLNDTQPPFGGSKEEYEELFSPYFDILIMEPCRNSHESRFGKELFISFKRKSF